MLSNDLESYLKDLGFDLSDEAKSENQNKTVIVGMSGGVDSSVCAFLCKALGYKTIGIFMKNWEEIDADGVCSAEEDYKDVISVSEKLGIQYYSLNFSKEYADNVFQSFVEEYKAGHTPNPDILCNREIKFKVFFDKARELGADFLATGHYCQNINNQLIKGKDQNKDQTYFLYTINQNVLKNVMFPIGHLEKPQVRKIAELAQLSTFKKKDSTGICFIGERNFKKFLSQYIRSQKGAFVHLDSDKELGEHEGMCFYTPGQRKGMGIGGPGGPWFVSHKDPKTNTVFVVEGDSHPALYADYLIAKELSWVNGSPSFPKSLKAKVRYRQNDQECHIELLGPDMVKVTFDQPQRAISLRQSIVFYEGDKCIGGGVISEKGPSYFEQGKQLPVA